MSRLRLGTRDIMQIILAFPFTFFGITFAQQLVTVTDQPFAWTSGGGQVLQQMFGQHRLDFWNLMGFWYFLAVVVYIFVSVVLFGIMILDYVNHGRVSEQVLKTREFLSELAYLTLIALSPLAAFHISRLMLSLVPSLDPEYCGQVASMGSQCVANQPIPSISWSFRSVPLSSAPSELMVYSVGLLTLYLVALILLRNTNLVAKILRAFRLPRPTAQAGPADDRQQLDTG